MISRNGIRPSLYWLLIVLVVYPFGCSPGRIKGDIRIVRVNIERSSLQIEACARNRGTASHRFAVGCSLQRKDYSWLDIPFQLHEIEPEQSVAVEFNLDSIDMNDFFIVRVAIWKSVNSDGTLNTRFAMDERPLPRGDGIALTITPLLRAVSK